MIYRGFRARFVSAACWWFFAASVGFFSFALYTAIGNIYFIKHSVATKAAIVNLAQDPNNRAYLCPQFSFTAADTRTYVITSQNCASPPEFKVGDTVPVFYRSENPATARIDSDAQLRSIPLWEAEWGVATMLIGFLLRWYARKRGIPLVLS